MRTKNQKSKRRNPMAKWPFIFLAPFLISYLCFTLYPTLYSLRVSFTSWTAINMAEKPFVGLKNYIRIFTADPLFWKSVGNTLKLMVLAMPLTIITGLMMAVLMQSVRRFKQTVQTINFLPYVITPIAIGLLFSFLFSWNVGIVNRVLMSIGLISEHINWLGTPQYAPFVVALMIIWKNFGYFMVLYMAGLSTIPVELYDAAKVDGAGAIQSFFTITLPLLRPITVFVVINGIIGGLQLFDEAQQVFLGTGSKAAGGPMRSCLTVIWYFYDTSFKNNSRYGYGAAIAFSLFVIIAVLSMINVRALNRKEVG